MVIMVIILCLKVPTVCSKLISHAKLGPELES